MRVTLAKETYVNVYELDRAYGGAEEGGWWFSTGTLMESRHVAIEAVETVRSQLEEMHHSAATPVSSVNYRGGVYGVFWEDDPGADFPAETPHYE